MIPIIAMGSASQRGNQSPDGEDMESGRTDSLAAKLATMDREGLICILRTMRCTFPLDFTEEFLQTVGVERLRHIVLAAAVREQKAA